MTQDPPFQYVLLILTLSRKNNSTVSIHDVDDVNKKRVFILLTAEAE